MNNRMWEHPATRANLEHAAARAARAIVAPATGALASKGEWGVGRLAEPAEILAAIEARARPARASRRARSTGCACSSPPAARASRSTPCATSATARPGRMGFALAAEAARRGAEVTLVAANVALPRRRGVRLRRRRDRRRAAEAARASAFADADVLLMAAAVADFRPAAPRRTRSRRPAATGWRSSSSRPRTCWPRWRRAARRTRRWSASPPSTASGAVERGARQARAQGARRRRGQRHLARGDRLRLAPTTRSRSSPRRGERHVPRGSKEAVAAAILDEVERAAGQRAERGTVEAEP